MENDNTGENVAETKEVQAETIEEVPAQAAEEGTPSEPESVEAKLAHAEAEAAKYRRLFEKANKPKEPAAPKAPSVPTPSVEETVLLAQGMSEELLTELKALAAVRKTTLIKAQNDPIFVSLKREMEKEQKQKDASLPASRSSGATKAKKDFTTPGLTREEHRQMVADALKS